ncbi:hypothetical protein J6590_051707 [Homalodisca vitripennis]|nr:hypothetical protein J6590_051707 [Homalodisca vitripennis]
MNAKKTPYHVTRLLSFDLDRDTRAEVKNVSLQMSNGKVEFTVLGLFTIDLSLIALMIGMSISYTIMVLQMDYSQ